MKTSRQRVLEYVSSQRVVTAADIARALRMTEANARHHLGILDAQGLVNVIERRPGTGKGRPSNLYGLSEQAAGHNLNLLCTALMAELMRTSPADAQQVTFGRLTAHMIANITGTHAPQEPASREALKPGVHLTQRLNQAILILNKMSYQARWEARALAPHIILGHCPYLAVLAANPELCQLDAVLLEQLLDSPVDQMAKLVLDQRGLRLCIFQIRKR